MTRPRVLLINQFFQPEPNELRGSAFVHDLIKRGIDVEVLTGFPNYPQGSLYPGYSMRPYSREIVDGITVHRVAHFVSHDTSGLRRALSYLTLMLTTSLFVCAKRSQYELVWVQQGPATLGATGALWSLLTNRPSVLDAQDLWPDSVTTTGMLPKWFPVALVAAFSRIVAKSADRVVTLSVGAETRLQELGVDRSKIEVIYNWCSENAGDAATEQEATRILSNVASKTIVTYVGSFGVLQDLVTVVRAADLLKHKSVGFVLAGDGVEFDVVLELANKLGLNNVHFPGRVSHQVGGAISSQGDITLLHLRESELSQSAVPSKLASNLYAAKPTVVAAEGAAAKIADEAGSGVTCRSGDAGELASKIMDIADRSDQERVELGRAGATFYSERMSMAAGVARIADIVFDLTGRTSVTRRLPSRSESSS